MSNKINRRTFIKTVATAGGAAAILPQTLFSFRIKKESESRIYWEWDLEVSGCYGWLQNTRKLKYRLYVIDNEMIDNALKILKDGGKPVHVYIKMEMKIS